ncbi:hypothetical protein RJZ90_004892 [Blastomyces dermatitidis]
MEFNPTSPSKATPLSDRSTNTHLPTGAAPPMTTGHCGTDLKAATEMSMEYHRQVLKEKMKNGKSEKGHYISPSDGIMSPCTKKLSDLKGKRFKKYAAFSCSPLPSPSPHVPTLLYINQSIEILQV